MVRNVFSPPTQFVLYPSPRFHLLRTNAVAFSTPVLQGDFVNYILVDWRCDHLKAILVRGGEMQDETLEIYCAFDYPCMEAPLNGGMSWWSRVCSWVYRPHYESQGISLVLLSEAFLGIDDADRKFGTYVDVLRPDVVIVTECWMITGIHETLMTIFNDCLMMELKGGGENVLWFYFDNGKVRVCSQMENDRTVVDIIRL